MTADYHVHTPYCGHAGGKTIEYVQAAIRKGIPEIGFADHLGRYYLSRSQQKRYWDWGMNARNLARYYEELRELKETFNGKITIRIGLEVDYIEGAEDLLPPLLKPYSFDFLLGSIHCLPSFGWRHLAKYTAAHTIDIYKTYFKVVRSAIGSGLFQSLAHIDFIWRYIPWPEDNSQEVFSAIDDIVRMAAGSRTCIEINANGFIWSQTNAITGNDPFIVLLNSIRKYKARISLGSDAHTPADVGNSFGDIIDLLDTHGIHSFSVFENKKRSTVPLG